MTAPWNVESLRKYLAAQLRAEHDLTTEKFASLRRYHDTDVDALTDRIDKAEQAVEKRLEEIPRLSDRLSRTITRDEYTNAHAALVAVVNEVTKNAASQAGKGQGMSQFWGFLVAGIASFGAIVAAVGLLVELVNRAHGT